MKSVLLSLKLSPQSISLQHNTFVDTMIESSACVFRYTTTRMQHLTNTIQNYS